MGLHLEENQWYVAKPETPLKQNTKEQLAQYVAQSLAGSKDKRGLIKELVKQGWSHETGFYRTSGYTRKIGVILALKCLGWARTYWELTNGGSTEFDN